MNQYREIIIRVSGVQVPPPLPLNSEKVGLFLIKWYCINLRVLMRVKIFFYVLMITNNNMVLAFYYVTFE